MRNKNIFNIMIEKGAIKGDIVNPNQSIRNSTLKKTNWGLQHNITPRQLEILRLVRNGLSNQNIAAELFISEATVKTHIIAIFQVLNAKNRTQAIQKAQQLGLD